MKTVAVLHTTPVTIAGLAPHFSTELEGVRQTNFLDDTILPEINREGGITPAVRYRIYSMMTMAAASGADAILCACSSVGGLLEEGRSLVAVPALRIDGPMAEEAVSRSDSVAIAATLPSTLGPTADLIGRTAARLGKTVRIETVLVEGAGELLAQQRMEEYEALIASRLGEALASCGVVALAQASMAGAAARLPQADQARVLSSPRSGVAALRKVLFG